MILENEVQPSSDTKTITATSKDEISLKDLERRNIVAERLQSELSDVIHELQNKVNTIEAKMRACRKSKVEHNALLKRLKYVLLN